jgi:hypothetical protein
MKTYNLRSATCFGKWCRVEKYCSAGQAANGIRFMRIACWIPKATDTHLEYVILVAFPLQKKVVRKGLNVTL